MGVNLTIETDNWDAYANAGMKEIFYNRERFPRVRRGHDMDDESKFRPVDFTLWRKEIIALDCNVDMWLRGLEALESDPDLWIDASY